MKYSGTTSERVAEPALEETISRALRENLVPLQDTVEEIQRAYADVVAACTSGKPGDALASMLRAQTAAAALAGGLSALSTFVANFVANSAASSAAAGLNPAERRAALDGQAFAPGRSAAPAFETPSAIAEPEAESEWAEETAQVPVEPEEVPLASSVAPASVPESAEEISLAVEPPIPPPHEQPQQERTSYATAEGEPSVTEAPAAETAPAQPEFDITIFPAEIQELHRRANRVAKVAMQDIKLLRPKDVQLGREHNDICNRLRSDIDKARKEYDRRFRAIQDHPVDYFHRWMVEILAGGNSNALGEYPYPSPVLRR